MINKSYSRYAVVGFCYHSYDNRPNWTPLSLLPLLKDFLIVEVFSNYALLHKQTKPASLTSVDRLTGGSSTRKRACNIGNNNNNNNNNNNDNNNNNINNNNSNNNNNYLPCKLL